MFQFRRRLGLCEASHGESVVLYPAGRFFSGVRLNEQELEAEKAANTLTWKQAIFLFAGSWLGAALAKLAPSGFLGPALIACVTFVFCLLLRRYRLLRRKYPDHDWTLRTPFQRERAGEIELPKFEYITLPINFVVLAVAVTGVIIVLSGSITLERLGMLIAFVYFTILSIGWLTYSLIFSRRRLYLIPK